ncbi:Kinesin-like protein KIF23, partial [Geodia barretti]
MKSSKGKVPVGGKAKRVTVVPHGARKQKEKDPVEVFCRVRPLKEEEGESCMSIVRDNRLQIEPPESSLAFKSGQKNPTQHTFKRVINGTSSQSTVYDMVGFPLTEQLLQGKHGLLFAYGITNSGKTYTMTGEPDAPGILPRCLDVIFNSIAEVQAPKFVFRPDGSNGFNIFSESDARVEQYRNRGKKVSPRMRAAESEFSEMLRVPDQRKVTEGVDEDSQYAVFVSYVEIYNNYAFDLLEDTPVDSIVPKPPKSKNLREDTNHNMYVSGGTEVEVKSTEEAFDVLQRGQKRRRVAMTTMNTESSRSHSVFTIRLVQAPLNHSGEAVIEDKSLLTISQLSLVDLAGSERTTRTHCTGDRLREANNINANLMVLRTCMETLRDNQVGGGATRIVPYRDSKLTHLFKNYFDGQGRVAMIVCVSPSSTDYDETIHVMRFAEVTQEVMVSRPQEVKKQVGLAPGRHRANMLFKAALKETRAVEGDSTSGPPSSHQPVKDVPHPYLLALGVLSVQKYLSAECGEESLKEFRESLENRGRVRSQLIDDLKKKQRAFREQLCVMEGQLGSLQTSCEELGTQRKNSERKDKENNRLKTVISSQDENIARLQAELERCHAATMSKGHELSQALQQVAMVTEQLEHLSQERELLLRTTEMYEVEKRELQDEVYSQCPLMYWERYGVLTETSNHL